LAGVVYGLVEASNAGLAATRVLLSIAAGVILLVAFVVVEMRSPTPMMPLDLFRSRTFSGANLLTLLLYAALGGMLFFLPFALIQAHGYSPTAAGSSLLPFPIVLFALSRWSGGLVDRFGPRLPLLIGPLIASLGFALMALPGVGGGYWTTFFPAIAVLALGMAVTIAPLTTAVMGAVEAQRSGVASGINNAVSRLAGLLAIAILGIVAVASFGSALEASPAVVSAPPSVRQAMLEQKNRLAAIEIPQDAGQPTAAALKAAVDDAYLRCFRLVAFSCAGLAVLGALGAYALVDGGAPKRPDRPPQRRNSEHPA
ncbi:MAG TPA: MFS transporter, partial [Anaerolineae bacterium]